MIRELYEFGTLNVPAVEELTSQGSYQSVGLALERDTAAAWRLPARDAQQQVEDALTSGYGLQWLQILPGFPIARRDQPAPRDFTPYVALVRELIEREQIGAARQLLATASRELLTEDGLSRWRQVLAPARVRVIKKADVDRVREYRWLAAHAQSYRGQWVAIDGENLLAHASSLRELRELLKTVAPRRPPLVHRVD